MFSGIIDAKGSIVSADEVAGGRKLVIRAHDYWTDVDRGGSIAIDGVCLTLTRSDREQAEFDVIAETLRRTTLGSLRPGGEVNLQKSLAAGDRIDGHFVQGHVDATAAVAKVEQSARESIWWFALDREALTYVTPKGSIAVDGISLTVVDVRDDLFGVALIPTTLGRTTIGAKKVGDRVNIETDVLARTVVGYLRNLISQSSGAARGITADLLSQMGFD